MSHNHPITLLILLMAGSAVVANEGIAGRSSVPAPTAQDVAPGLRATSSDLSNSHPMSVGSRAALRRPTAATGRAVQGTGQGADQTVLPPPVVSRSRPQQTTRSKKQSSDRALITVGSSLAVVLGVFFVVVWVSRKTTPRALASLPGEVVESLGRAPLVGRQQAQLLRVGKKLVLVSITPSGVEPITEITDAAEVDRLCALCQQARPGSITATFRSVLSQYATEPTTGGFVGQ